MNPTTNNQAIYLNVYGLGGRDCCLHGLSFAGTAMVTEVAVSNPRTTHSHTTLPWQHYSN